MKVQTVHNGSKRNKKKINLCESKPGISFALMQHSELKIEENVIDATVPGTSFGLPEDAMNAWAKLQRETYHVGSLHNIAFFLFVD